MGETELSLVRAGEQEWLDGMRELVVTPWALGLSEGLG